MQQIASADNGGELVESANRLFGSCGFSEAPKEGGLSVVSLPAPLGAIVSAAACRLLLFPKQSQLVLHVHLIATDADYRGKGHASSLLRRLKELLIQRAREDSVSTIQILVAPRTGDNDDALNWWRRQLGLQAILRGPAHRRGGAAGSPAGSPAVPSYLQANTSLADATALFTQLNKKCSGHKWNQWNATCLLAEVVIT